MAQSDASLKWLPLLEYSLKKNISLSTLRRYIKAQKINFRMENGRYYILDQTMELPVSQLHLTDDLELELKKAHQEIAELKMLIELYEEQLFKKDPLLNI